jgi:hypothetical protein
VCVLSSISRLLGLHGSSSHLQHKYDERHQEKKMRLRVRGREEMLESFLLTDNSSPLREGRHSAVFRFLDAETHISHTLSSLSHHVP